MFFPSLISRNTFCRKTWRSVRLILFLFSSGHNVLYKELLKYFGPWCENGHSGGMWHSFSCSVRFGIKHVIYVPSLCCCVHKRWMETTTEVNLQKPKPFKIISSTLSFTHWKTHTERNLSQNAINIFSPKWIEAK